MILLHAIVACCCGAVALVGSPVMLFNGVCAHTEGGAPIDYLCVCVNKV